MYRGHMPTLRTVIDRLEELAKKHGDQTPVIPMTFGTCVIMTDLQRNKTVMVETGVVPESLFQQVAQEMDKRFAHERVELAVRIF